MMSWRTRRTEVAGKRVNWIPGIVLFAVKRAVRWQHVSHTEGLVKKTRYHRRYKAQRRQGMALNYGEHTWHKVHNSVMEAKD
jgi:hypothetical protein